MSKKILLVLILTLFGILTFAKNVPVNKAKNVAINYMAVINSDFNNTVIETVNISYQNYNVIYAFNFKDGGYILISADDKAYPILNYSFKGKFINDESKMPDGYLFWFNGYKNQIAQIKDLNLRPYDKTVLTWNKYSTETTTYINKSTSEVTTPLFGIDGVAGSIRWNQLPNYNDSCPVNAGNYTGRSPVGCVATAMSQIMYYHRYPSSGTGSYSYGFGSVNFGTSTYNWDVMASSISSSSPQATREEVAKISYHTGVAVNMNYGAETSGAVVQGNVKEAFLDYFRYNAEFSKRETMNNDTQWKNIMKTNLDNGNPLFYPGNNGGSVGHAFVCDGYNNNDEFHFNFGWSGSKNGWFNIDNLSPDSGLDFSQRQKMVYDIYPMGMIVDFSANSTTINEGETVTFTDLSSDTPTSWNWNFGDGTTNSTQQNPTHTYTTAGTYTVSLTATNSEGTSSTETKTNYITVLGPATTPVANFSANLTTISENGSIVFTDESTNTPTSWEWNFGDGTTNSTQQNPTHTYTTAGAYTVSLTATNTADSNTITKTDYITVNEGSNDLIMHTGNITTCSAIFHDDGYTSNYTPNKDFVLTINPETSGNMIKVIFSEFELEYNSSCQYDYLEIYDGTSTSSSLIGKYCGTTSPGTITATNNDGALTYKFHSDAITEKLGWVSSISCVAGGIPNAPTANFSANNTSIFENETVIFSDLSTNTPTSWEWNFGDGTTNSTQQNPSHTYTSAGTYTVSLTATNNGGFDTETKTNFITVNILTNNPPTVETYSASSVATTSATLNGYISNNGGVTVSESGFVYSTSNTNPIINGSGVTQIETSPTVTMGSFSKSITGLTTTITYYYKAYAINTEGVSYGSVKSFTPDYMAGNHAVFISQNIPTTVATNEVFNVSLTFENTGNTTWEAGNNYNLGSQSPQDNYTWGVNRIAVPNSVTPGEQVTITANLTAPSTVETYNFQWQMVQDAVAWFGEFSDIFSITVTTSTGIYYTKNTSINIYPNPVSSILTINGVNENAEISVFDLYGKKVLSQKTNSNTIDVSDLSEGIYIVNITSENETVNYKIIKK